MVELSGKLLRWYYASKRDLPWRRTSDPYMIWVSEVMLQQTRVAAVIERYVAFTVKYPDIATLAAATIDEVLTDWSGLGYYRRARNLHAAARVIVEQHEGVFPREYSDVRALPGVGDYTAAAVCAIAYGQPVPAVDGNVVRVMSRLWAMETPSPSPAATRDAKQRVTDLMPPDAAGDFTQALMELGALVCTPKSPRCGDCPWRIDCGAKATNREGDLPVRLAKTKQPVVKRTIALVRRDGEYLLRRRPEKGLLGGMWEFPGVNADESFADSGLDVTLHDKLIDTRHVFTHLCWEMEVRSGALSCEPKGEYIWATPERMKSLALPSAFAAIRRYIENDRRASHE